MHLSESSVTFKCLYNKGGKNHFTMAIKKIVIYVGKSKKFPLKCKFLRFYSLIVKFINCNCKIFDMWFLFCMVFLRVNCFSVMSLPFSIYVYFKGIRNKGLCDRLWVQFLLEEIKYLLFSFFRSGVEAQRRTKSFHHTTAPQSGVS